MLWDRHDQHVALEWCAASCSYVIWLTGGSWWTGCSPISYNRGVRPQRSHHHVLPVICSQNFNFLFFSPKWMVCILQLGPHGDFGQAKDWPHSNQGLRKEGGGWEDLGWLASFSRLNRWSARCKYSPSHPPSVLCKDSDTTVELQNVEDAVLPHGQNPAKMQDAIASCVTSVFNSYSFCS